MSGRQVIMRNEEVHVVIGRGPLGKAVVKELLRKRKRVRVIGVTNKHTGFPKEVEEVTYNVSIKDEAKAAFKGSTVVYQCSAPPYNKWSELFPILIRGIIEGVSYNNARLVMGDNMYMYGEVSGSLNESLPYKAITKKGMARATVAKEILKAYQKGQLEATIGRGSDFFGPHAFNSTIGRVFPNIAKGKKATVIGDPDQLHTYTFIEDFAKALVILGENSQSIGQIWHVPNAQTVTTRQFLTTAYEQAGYTPKIKSIGKNILRLGGLFSSNAKEVIELLYQFEKPFIVDHRKFVETFGNCSTPLKESLKKTVSWYRSHEK